MLREATYSPPALPVEDTDTPAAAPQPVPASGARRRRRRLAQATALLLLVGAALPLGLWLHGRATHIVTGNALVRSHLTDLGVRGQGVVRDIYVRAGDRVRKGQLLAHLDDSHLQAVRSQAAAQVATLEEEIALQETSLALGREDADAALARAEANVRRLEAEHRAAMLQADDARASLAARQSLGDGGAISAETLRDARARAATAEALAAAADAAAAEARAALRTATLGVKRVALVEAQLRVLKARRREAEARLAEVDANLDAMRVVAPADGAVIRRLMQPGMAVDTGMPILSLWLTEDTWVEAWIPEASLGGVGTDAPVQVSFAAIPGERFEGTIHRVGLATDFEMPADYLPQTRETRMRPTPQVGVEIRIEDLPPQLRPGVSATVRIPRSDR
ncbi:efflux RND transporter periplasmic adaptor subunit [uncultured Thiohalocapsa sp.]|uniref:HlyD family secretion protein n=1 Tax=uncultured Thiohalocapsa sp. TaxID=768990 RepID=UPI0025EA7712|nr:efflux RND transporter periplasmic adaptor subunit [uncultured Thiohalocapsa sp.]